ncbi:MAG: hypothetical protein O3C23_00585 [bacterium]|nr:hypothetical protein [bacterium]
MLTMLTIQLQEITSEPEIWLFPENDGFLWIVRIPGLEFGLWGADSYIFCTSSRALRRTLLRAVQGAKAWGSVLEAPKLQRVFVPASPPIVVEALHNSLGNPVLLTA